AHIHEKSEAAKAEKERAKALLQKYEQELPGREAEAESREASYHAIMEQKDVSETEWKELTESYDKSKIDELQQGIQAYSEKKKTAAVMKAAAEEAIGDSPKPVLETLEQEMRETQERWTTAGKLLETCKSEYKAALEVYEELAARQVASGETLEAHARLEGLYKQASGNISGGRMDLETYVQRYYMEQILYDANRRFSEMSAGQFELRMVKPEKAGDGRNRGLDLMVYSTVTGREREIRTLSGGESFMAALSLALGMADQIREHSAAIHLDIMFVDEGFGSLDEQSRHQAVRVLKEMAEGSRLIGIISHVTELKQEIDDQLLVTKDDAGSHVRWNIFT
ncbi:MAG: SMC family ATPase, partial [Lachnospiraceae bacterium]|nr:SMC family ATPase [Lachnospiraceae bacterium]